jgi:hypothetical protein
MEQGARSRGQGKRINDPEASGRLTKETKGKKQGARSVEEELTITAQGPTSPSVHQVISPSILAAINYDNKYCTLLKSCHLLKELIN